MSSDAPLTIQSSLGSSITKKMKIIATPFIDENIAYYKSEHPRCIIVKDKLFLCRMAEDKYSYTFDLGNDIIIYGDSMSESEEIVYEINELPNIEHIEITEVDGLKNIMTNEEFITMIKSSATVPIYKNSTIEIDDIKCKISVPIKSLNKYGMITESTTFSFHKSFFNFYIVKEVRNITANLNKMGHNISKSINAINI